MPNMAMALTPGAGQGDDEQAGGVQDAGVGVIDSVYSLDDIATAHRSLEISGGFASASSRSPGSHDDDPPALSRRRRGAFPDAGGSGDVVIEGIHEVLPDGLLEGAGQTSTRPTTPAMIPLTVPETARLLVHPPPPGAAGNWLAWRRRHQALSAWYHQRTRLARESKFLQVQ